jgi:rhodanese-related sulfurtransferase
MTAKLLMWVPLVLAAMVAGVPGCATDVSTAEARQMVRKGALLVDLRSKREYDERHAEGAVNMSVDELETKMSTLPPTQPVVLYCHTGARAGVATAKLRKQGYKNVHNLGSLGHWYKEHQSGSGF